MYLSFYVYVYVYDSYVCICVHVYVCVYISRLSVFFPCCATCGSLRRVPLELTDSIESKSGTNI